MGFFSLHRFLLFGGGGSPPTSAPPSPSPALLTIIEREQQHRRQAVPGLQLLLGHDVLPQQPFVDLGPHRHPPIALGLELEQQIQVDIDAVSGR